MGKKSRAKRERREHGEPRELKRAPGLLAQEKQPYRRQALHMREAEARFQQDVTRVASVLRRYGRVDAAVALSISEVWPMNVASPVKHLFAWAVLMGLSEEATDAQPIDTYERFARFANELYAAWPEFPMLEDFAPQGDWGEVRVRLGNEYVPMFYGSSLERPPDYVQAFRITHAAKEKALADMDLAVAVQAELIRAVSRQAGGELSEPHSGHVEVPPEKFWSPCRQSLLAMSELTQGWRAVTTSGLTAALGQYKMPLTWDEFSDAVMTGQVVPHIGALHNEFWFPIAVRGAPGVVCDHWAKVGSTAVTHQSLTALAEFASHRFRNVFEGPMTLCVGQVRFNAIPVSFIAPGSAKVHVFCVCDHQSLEAAGAAAESVYAVLKTGGVAHFLDGHGQALTFGKGRKEGPGIDDVQIVLVLTQAGTSPNMLHAPEEPTIVMPLVDLVSIFDALEDFEELERFWDFVDAQNPMLSPFSRGLGDLFATFKDTHGVLVDGAVNPSLIALDPHWGTEWRFKALSDFWAAAPRRFPDGNEGWRVHRTANGVVEMKSRSRSVLAYSTEVGVCTVQGVVAIEPGLEERDGRMLDLFAQMVVDGLQDHANEFASALLFGPRQLVLECRLAEGTGRDPDNPPPLPESFNRVVVSAAGQIKPVTRIDLRIHAGAVQAGLNEAKTAEFQARCVKETLRTCAEVLGAAAPVDLDARLASMAQSPARYRLQVVARTVDVPDIADPIVPTSTEYKLARKALAFTMKQIGLEPGRYELQEAKARLNSARDLLRLQIEDRLKPLNRELLVIACIEQHDAVLLAERMKETRVQQSRLHQVDYDRLDALTEARKEFGAAGRHYRYLLEKTVSSTTTGAERVNDRTLRELLGMIDWYMVLANASDALHNEVDAAGVKIDDSFIPEVFYSDVWQQRENEFAREIAKLKLGEGVHKADAIVAPAAELLGDETLKTAFKQDAGFELLVLLQALTVLSQPVRHGIEEESAFVYLATPERLVQALVDSIEGMTESLGAKLVSFLTLSAPDIRRLPGKSVDESDVPFWEHSKRLHRLTIRPLVALPGQLVWGAELASRAQNIWLSAVREGVLPADFPWPSVQTRVRAIKESIEIELERRALEIFKRHTDYAEGGIDFFKRFAKEGFEDVGDYDVLAYWPATNTIAFVECKYNQPPHSMKDARRLRDRIYGTSELDRKGQFSRIRGRREFLAKYRVRMLELMNWPKPADVPPRDVEVYVARDLYFWMKHPAYEVPTRFVRIDALDAWIQAELKP